MKFLWYFLIIWISKALNAGYFEKFLSPIKVPHDMIFLEGISVSYFINEKNISDNSNNFDFFVLNTDLSDLELRVRLIAESNEIPTIIIGKGANTEWTFYTEPISECYKKNLNIFLSWLKIDKLAVFYSSSHESIETNSFIRSEFPRSNSAFIEENINDLKNEDLIGKYFKSQGFKDYLVLLSNRYCDLIVSGFKKLNMNKNWNLLILGDHCFIDTRHIGILSLVYFEYETAKNYRTFVASSIKRFTDNIKLKTLNRFQIRKLFENVQTVCKYSIVNNINNGKVTVGYIEDGVVTSIRNITYFENLEYRITQKLTPITISTSSDDFDSSLYDPKQNQMYHHGIQYMIDYVNQNQDYLQDFEVKLLKGIECETYSLESNTCIKFNQNKLGVAFIPSFYFASISTIQNFRAQSINIPVVNGMGSTSKNSSMPSNYFRLVSTLDNILHYSTSILRLFNPLNIIIFYSDDPWGQMIYSQLVSFDQINLLKIVNNKKYHQVPLDFKPSMLKNFTNHIEDAIETGCYFMILAMSHPAPFYFLEALYDYGIRRGDFAYFFVTPTGSDALKVEEKEQRKKREELLHGSHFVYASYWSGPFGKILKEKYDVSKSETWLPCFYMDAVLSIIQAVKILIKQGKDYENWSYLSNTLKSLKFIGVTGSVIFDQTSLSRELNSVSLYNMFQDPNSKDFVIKETAKASPMSLDYLKIEKSVWPLGELQPKSMKNFYLNCEFFQYKVNLNRRSMIIETLINVFVMMASGLVALVFVCINGVVSIDMMNCIRFLETGDYLGFLAVLIEPFQMISIGPSMIDISPGFGKYINLLSLNWFKTFQIRDESYWILLYLILIFMTFCLFILCLSRLKVSCINKYMSYIRFIENYIEVIMLNYLFIPIFSFLSSIFSCRYSQDSKPAFLDTDCHYTCWSGSHIPLSIICSFLLLILSVLSYIYNAHQQNNSSTNFKSSQTYVILKLFVCILINTSQKLLIISNIHSKLIFAFIFLINMLGILAFTLKHNCYNYDRLNLWTKFLYLCVVWNTFVYILGITCDAREIWIVLVNVLGWFMIICFGVWRSLKLPPSLLVVKQGKTVYQMLKLAFDFGFLKRSLVYRIKNKDFMERNRY